MARKSQLVVNLEAEVAKLRIENQLLIRQSTERTEVRGRWEDFRTAVLQQQHLLAKAADEFESDARHVRVTVASLSRAASRLLREPGEPGAYGK